MVIFNQIGTSVTFRIEEKAQFVKLGLFLAYEIFPISSKVGVFSFSAIG